MKCLLRAVMVAILFVSGKSFAVSSVDLIVSDEAWEAREKIEIEMTQAQQNHWVSWAKKVERTETLSDFRRVIESAISEPVVYGDYGVISGMSSRLILLVLMSSIEKKIVTLANVKGPYGPSEAEVFELVRDIVTQTSQSLGRLSVQEQPRFKKLMSNVLFRLAENHIMSFNDYAKFLISSADILSNGNSQLKYELLFEFGFHYLAKRLTTRALIEIFCRKAFQGDLATNDFAFQGIDVLSKERYGLGSLKWFFEGAMSPYFDELVEKHWSAIQENPLKTGNGFFSMSCQSIFHSN